MRYLSGEAKLAGVSPGARYATILGVVPDLLAGTCSPEELQRADEEVAHLLRKFSPFLRRRSEHLENGLYLLDASGLAQAFKGYRRWASELVRAFRSRHWEVRLALGFTPFATEMATYHLTSERPIKIFASRSQEESTTLGTPLTAFSLSPDQIARLRRFKVLTLGEFLALEWEEVKRRFGGDLLEFYQKAVGAIFSAFSPLPEEEPLSRERGFPQPVAELEVLLDTARSLLRELLPLLLSREQAVAAVSLTFETEDNQPRRQVLRPTAPTADVNWLITLIRLRLEKHFQACPLRWGSRIERLVVEVTGEADPEKQGDLFTDWALERSGLGEETLAPRDKQAALWALSQVRAEFGEGSLVRAWIADHHLPDRDHYWKAEKESMEWLSEWKKGRKRAHSSLGEGALDARVRRILYQPVGLSRRTEWQSLHGPYSVSGGWWAESYAREYSFGQKEEQTAWLYQDLISKRLRVQGWLQ